MTKQRLLFTMAVVEEIAATALKGMVHDDPSRHVVGHTMLFHQAATEEACSNSRGGSSSTRGPNPNPNPNPNLDPNPNPNPVTFIPDGLPYVTWQPSKWEHGVNSNRDVQELFRWTDSDVGSGQVGLRWLKSGKYKQAIMKGHLTIGLHGLIFKHSAHLGVQNNTVIMDAIMEEDGRADCDDGDEDAM